MRLRERDISRRPSVRLDEGVEADTEDAGELGEGEQRDVELAAFDAGDVGAIQFGFMREGFLRETLGGSGPADARADALEQFGVADLGRHAGMVGGLVCGGLRDIYRRFCRGVVE